MAEQLRLHLAPAQVGLHDAVRPLPPGRQEHHTDGGFCVLSGGWRRGAGRRRWPAYGPPRCGRCRRRPQALSRSAASRFRPPVPVRGLVVSIRTPSASAGAGLSPRGSRMSPVSRPRDSVSTSPGLPPRGTASRPVPVSAGSWAWRISLPWSCRTGQSSRPMINAKALSAPRRRSAGPARRAPRVDISKQSSSIASASPIATAVWRFSAAPAASVPKPNPHW